MTLSKPEVWTLVHAERARLIDDLDALEAPAWDAPSLCLGWTVHDVLAHLLDTAWTGRLAFVWSLARARGDFDRANDEGVRRCKQPDPRRTLAEFRAAAEMTRTPPANRATRLVEAIVHGEDIRRPLGISRDYPAAGVRDALDYQLRTGESLGGGREQAAGCRLLASDSGDTWGDGLEVTGKAIDLLLAVSGRAIDPDLLSGPGAFRLISPRDSS